MEQRRKKIRVLVRDLGIQDSLMEKLVREGGREGAANGVNYFSLLNMIINLFRLADFFLQKPSQDKDSLRYERLGKVLLCLHSI